jgi:hypothetical protein
MRVPMKQANSSAMITARFDLSGKHIFVGISSGSILVFNTRTKTVIRNTSRPPLPLIVVCLSRWLHDTKYPVQVPSKPSISTNQEGKQYLHLLYVSTQTLLIKDV